MQADLIIVVALGYLAFTLVNESRKYRPRRPRDGNR